MTREQKRSALLVGLTIVVAALVIMDRFGGDSQSDGETTSAKTEYLRQAELVADMQQFITSAPDWKTAHTQAKEQWREWRSRMIVAQTAELANAQLQRQLTQIVSDFGVTLSATSSPSVRTPIENEPMRVIGLSISIQASSPEKLNAFLDRIEHMPEARVNIRQLHTTGPRRIPAGEIGVQLDAELDLEALAWITQEASHVPAS